MICPVCPPASLAGGALGAYFGINPPKETKGKIVSLLITGALTCISIIALKIIFNISLCVGGFFTLRNFIRVSVIVFPLGVVHSIWVNFLLNLFVFPTEAKIKKEDLPKVQPNIQEKSPCCCQTNN